MHARSTTRVSEPAKPYKLVNETHTLVKETCTPVKEANTLAKEADKHKPGFDRSTQRLDRLLVPVCEVWASGAAGGVPLLRRPRHR